MISEGFPDFQVELKEKPLPVIACMGLAIHQLVTHHRRSQALAIARELGEGDGEEETYTAPMIHPRLVNFAAPLPLKSLKANYYG